MQYRKPKALMFLTLFGLAVALAAPAHAEAGDQVSHPHFKGPTSTCLFRADLVYPCVSLSPPAYHSNPMAGMLSVPLGPELPLDSDVRTDSWLEKIKSGEYWKEWHLTRQVRGMKMDFSLEHAGPTMNMDIGPLKFNVITEDGGLSESRFFLGIERSW